MSNSTGIIIGRFQTFELNAIHKQLIQNVRDRHSQVMIFLSSNPAPSDRNPMDFGIRLKMFQETYADSIPVYEMPDLPDDRIWSQELDRRVLEHRPEGKVTLYGREEQFTTRYSGRYETQIMEAMDIDLGGIDFEIPNIENNRDFRAGMLYAMSQLFPTVYPTVDVAVFRKDRKEVLLARKANETKYRFPGGFSDPEDESFEEAAIRELGEECGELSIEEFIYIGSARIEDWRYRDSKDTIITHLYACDLAEGEPVASDDIAELRWFDVSRLSEDHFVAEHIELYVLLLEFLEEEI